LLTVPKPNGMRLTATFSAVDPISDHGLHPVSASLMSAFATW